MKIVVAGGGAAGFFTSVNIARKHPAYEVILLEKTNKVLSKVKVSGGGRCNVTNAREKPSELVQFYPRGYKKLYSLFQRFGTADMVQWLADRGVPTHAEDDLRMFPVTNSSQTIIDCLVNEAWKHKVKLVQDCSLTGLEQVGDKWRLLTTSQTLEADKVVICTGSSSALWRMLEGLGLEIIPPVPSLFTFHINDSRLADLPGVSFTEAAIKVTGGKLEASGPLLITHWGLSGPAVLKISAWGAREFAITNYHFAIRVNFLGSLTVQQAMDALQKEKASNPKRKVSNYPQFDLPRRFWEQLTSYCGIGTDEIFGDLSKKQLNKLTEELTQGLYEVNGKSAFKEEFVTSGGVSLNEINLDTFESKKLKNLYLAGEIIDIDGLTGGFNFQACWSAGWVISESV